MNPRTAGCFLVLGGCVAIYAAAVLNPLLWVAGCVLFMLPALVRSTTTADLAAYAEREQARQIPGSRWDKARQGWVEVAPHGPGVKSARVPAHAYARWMDDPAAVRALTRRYLDGTIDVDQYTDLMEALPWTQTDSSKELNTEPRNRLRYGHSVLPDGDATSTGDSSSTATFGQRYSGVLGPSPLISAGHIKARDITTERITVTDPMAHPYGFTPEGLIAEVRVEYERWYYSRGWSMPPLVNREQWAEAEARRRWPGAFEAASAPDEPEHQHDWFTVAKANHVICSTCGERRHWQEANPFAAGRFA